MRRTEVPAPPFSPRRLLPLLLFYLRWEEEERKIRMGSVRRRFEPEVYQAVAYEDTALRCSREFDPAHVRPPDPPPVRAQLGFVVIRIIIVIITGGSNHSTKVVVALLEELLGRLLLIL